MIVLPFLIISCYIIMRITGLNWFNNKKDILFWVSFLFFFDPGGFFSGYTSGDILARVKYYDLFFAVMTLAYFSARHPNFRFEKDLGIMIRLLTMITFYFLVVYGILIPINNDYFDFSFFIQKNRQYFYAIPLLVYTYYFAIRSAKIFFVFLVSYSFLILLLFIFTVAFNAGIVPVQTWDRYGSKDRMSMISYGLIHWMVPLGLVVISFGKIIKPSYTRIILVAMFLMVVTYILTLTRREYLKIVFMVVFIPVFISNISKQSIFLKVKKYVFPTLLVIIAISYLFPKYVSFSTTLINDLFLTLTTGKDSQGVSEERLSGTGDFILVKKIIQDNPYFGIGYYPAQWSDILEMKSEGNSLGVALDASGEVPVYGAVMRLGFLGIIVPLFLYFFMWRKIIMRIKTIKKRISFFYEMQVELIIFLTMLYNIISMFTIECFNLFGEFFNPYGITLFASTLGILFGCYRTLNSHYKMKVNELPVL